MPESRLDPQSFTPTPQADVTTRAQFFVRLVQGTMALEGQAVDADGQQRLLEQAEHLLAVPQPVQADR
jgi:hypothetical protein